MDKYEVTVGRFRAFVEDYDNFTPQVGAGEHLAGAGTGWRTLWEKGDELPASAADLEAVLLGCHNDFLSWSTDRGTDTVERLPINCLDWYTAFAFCIWDGGRLPTEAEWEYAAGGSQGWSYPWGNSAPDDAVHAVFDSCGNDGSCGNTSYTDIVPVGSRASGNGFWGHADMAGSISEWVFDIYNSAYPSSCDNCANSSTGTGHVTRGGSWVNTADYITSAYRGQTNTTLALFFNGMRCVRVP